MTTIKFEASNYIRRDDMFNVTKYNLFNDMFYCNFNIIINGLKIPDSYTSEIPMLFFINEISQIDGEEFDDFDFIEYGESLYFRRVGDVYEITNSWSSESTSIAVCEFRNLVVKIVKSGIKFCEELQVNILQNEDYIAIKNTILSRLH